MKRVMRKEHRDLSDTWRVVCLITLFTAFLGAYFGGRGDGQGAIMAALLCSCSLVALYLADGELSISPEYIRFTETLPLSPRQKVYGKQLYLLIYRLGFLLATGLGFAGGLLTVGCFEGVHLAGFLCLEGLLLFLPGGLFMILTAKVSGINHPMPRVMLIMTSLLGGTFPLGAFFQGSFRPEGLQICILLAAGILLYFIAAEWAVSLWEERPLP